MKTYCVYDLQDQFLGELLAINEEVANALAEVLYSMPHRVLSYRLTSNRQVLS